MVIARFKKSYKFIIVTIILAFFAGAYFYFFNDTEPKYAVLVAERRDIYQKVSVTGKVKPVSNVDLSFEIGGKINQVYVDIGARVIVGQALAIIDNAEISAQLEQAKADFKAQEAKLSELRKGARAEEIQIQETKLSNSKISLNDAKNNMIDKLQDAYTKSDDAIRNKTDQFFANPRNVNPQLSFSPSSSQLETDIEWNRLLLEDSLPKWKTSVDQLKTSSDFPSIISDSRRHLEKIKSFLYDAALALSNLASQGSISQTTIDTWKSDVSTARTNVNTAITNIIVAEEKFKKAESDVLLAERELALKQVSATEEQINAQEAQVEKAKASISQYQAQLSKTVLRSPINGLITVQNAKIGEIVSANSLVASLISHNDFKVEANVPEADIAKIHIGSVARITLDAYGRDIVFDAKVISIDPAETIIDGVTTYKTTILFARQDGKIKSGMTANADIDGDIRKNVIAVPQRSLIRKDGNQFVRILRGDDNVVEVLVKTGLRGHDGSVEILDGINDGDHIIIFSEE